MDLFRFKFSQTAVLFYLFWRLVQTWIVTLFNIIQISIMTICSAVIRLTLMAYAALLTSFSVSAKSFLEEKYCLHAFRQQNSFLCSMKEMITINYYCSYIAKSLTVWRFWCRLQRHYLYCFSYSSMELDSVWYVHILALINVSEYIRGVLLCCKCLFGSQQRWNGLQG